MSFGHANLSVGDWFDFVENRDGSWLAIADTAGTGPTAAGLGASALGALRAARRSCQDLVQAAESIDEVVRALGNPSFVVTALLARWHAPTATLAWINCGHPPAYVVDGEGAFTELEGPVHAALGTGDKPPSFEVGGAIFLTVLPAALLIVALLMAVGVLARSYREGQTYLMPILRLVMLAGFASFLPGAELTAGTALVPLLNVTLLVHDILVGRAGPRR